MWTWEDFYAALDIDSDVMMENHDFTYMQDIGTEMAADPLWEMTWWQTYSMDTWDRWWGWVTASV